MFFKNVNAVTVSKLSHYLAYKGICGDVETLRVIIGGKLFHLLFEFFWCHGSPYHISRLEDVTNSSSNAGKDLHLTWLAFLQASSDNKVPTTIKPYDLSVYLFHHGIL